eukprot:1819025-Amphidinium_carterae.1
MAAGRVSRAALYMGDIGAGDAGPCMETSGLSAQERGWISGVAVCKSGVVMPELNAAELPHTSRASNCRCCDNALLLLIGAANPPPVRASA